MHSRPILTALLLPVLLTMAAPSFASDRSFGGYECPTSCADQKAGYLWAETQKVKDVASCSSGARGFIEGCRIFVEDPDRGADLDDQGHDIP